MDAKLQVSVGGDEEGCVFSVIDDGKGIEKSQINTLNSDQTICSTQKSVEETEYGLGLKIVRQIVKAHTGSLLFSETIP